MRILVLVVSDARKKSSSTSAMKRSVQTSELLKYRVDHIVPKRTTGIVQAIKDRNFQVFADLTMQDSNQFHAICLDTYPPCTYMNDVSHAIVDMVHTYNDFHGSNKVFNMEISLLESAFDNYTSASGILVIKILSVLLLTDVLSINLKL